jgi:hypothetical protein
MGRLSQSTNVWVVFVVAAVAGCNSSADHPPSLSNQEGPEQDATVPPVTVPPVEDAGDMIAHHDAGDGSSADATSGDALASCTANQPDANIVQMMCAGQCVNVDTDPHNCGGCGQACGITGTVCIQGKCACPTPQSVCSNRCVDTTQDQSNCGFCGHNCQGSPCMAGLCQPSNIAQATAQIQSIAVDATYVYWTQGPGSAAGAYRKAFASNATAAIVGAASDPRGIVVDNTDAFWADFADGSITAYARIGGSPVHLVPPVALDAGPSPGPTAIARDANNVYWVDSAAGTVNQMPVTQGPLQGGTVLQLAWGQPTPVAIAVDASNVYWVNYGTPGTNGSVNKVPIGSDAGAVTPLAPSEQQPSAIAVDATNVYWADKVNTTGAVKSIPIGGGSIKPIAQNQGAPAGVAVDSQYVYWTNYDDNTVQKAPLAGGMSYALASGQSNPSAIAVDDTNVYWANQGSGVITKVAK